jgi:competence protein ComFC
MAFNFKSLLHLLYPPLCLHCQERLPDVPPLFCPSCRTQLSLIPAEGRCRICFCEQEGGPCPRCSRRPTPLCCQLAAIESMGAAATLLRALLQGREEAIPAAAALMAYQWLEQKLPLPDLLIPLPLSKWRRYQLGFDVNYALARSVGALLSAPVASVLKSSWDWPAFMETAAMRATYTVHAKQPLADKCLLLIAPKLDDTALLSAATALQDHFPESLYVLALAL